MSHEEPLAPLRRGRSAEFWLIARCSAFATEEAGLRAGVRRENHPPCYECVRGGLVATWLLPRAGLAASQDCVNGRIGMCAPGRPLPVAKDTDEFECQLLVAALSCKELGC